MDLRPETRAVNCEPQTVIHASQRSNLPIRRFTVHGSQFAQQASAVESLPVSTETAQMTVQLKVRRQANVEAAAYWDTFDIPYRDKMNVISALQETQRNPVNDKGKTVEPPVWEAACLEE